MLTPLDLLVLLKVCAQRGRTKGQVRLAVELHISPSSVNSAFKHAAAVRLYSPERQRVNAPALFEALVHGAKYFLGPERGSAVRGIPTSWAAPPLVHQIATHDELPPVWPDPAGTVRGLEFKPLYPSVPKAAMEDNALYELLALVDALREGEARVGRLAEQELRARLLQP